MKKSLPVLGITLAVMLAFGAGCAEEDGLFGLGGSGGKKASPEASANPTAKPSGDISGGIR